MNATATTRSRTAVDVRALRRWFHRHPELAFREVKTAARIVEELDAIGLPWSYTGAGSGVIARLVTREGAPTVALRAEMDGLPGRETTGLPFASTLEGCMHACGHDAHMAMLIGAADRLSRRPPDGNVVFLFQPAEENGGGSRRVIADGGLVGVDAVFAGHVTQEFETGKIMVKDQIVTAQSDRFEISIQGKGGHGARPHETVDAVVVACFLVTALQTLVSRETNPLHPSVITIGQIEAGSAPNVIAEQASLKGSIRTTLPQARRNIHRGIRRMSEAAEMLHNADITTVIQDGYPPVVNTTRETGWAREAAARVVGRDHVVSTEYPSMGSEDFSYFLEQAPGCFVRFGARRPDREPVPLHSPSFDIDEGVLEIGSAWFDTLARQALRRLSS